MKLVYMISTAVLMVYAAEICAQTISRPVYIKVYGAYGFLSPGSFKGEPPKSLKQDTIIYKAGKRGLGEGIRVGAGFGFIVSDYVNIGLDVEYLEGRKIETTALASFSKTTISATSVFKHSLLTVMPNVTFKAVSQPAYHVYYRLGVIIAIPLKMTEDYEYQRTIREGFDFNSFWTLSNRYNAEYELKTGVGYQAALGIQVKVTDHVRWFGEISGYRLTLSRNRFEEIKKERKYTSPQAPSPQPPDYSRSIIIYQNEGSATTQVQGGTNNQIITMIRPQEPINLNAITAGAGIFYRF